MYTWQEALVRVWDGNPYDGGIYVGTAFLIAPGYLLTAKHVVTAVKDHKQIFLVSSFGAWGGSFFKADAPILHPDNLVDIAILPVKKQVQRKFCLSFCSDRKFDLKIGDKVFLGGFSSKDGTPECPEVPISAYFGSYHLSVTHTSIAKGLSGGPVLYNDKVVAVIRAREKDGTKTYLEPLSSFRSFLEDHLDVASQVQPISIKLDTNERLFVSLSVFPEKADYMQQLFGTMLAAGLAVLFWPLEPLGNFNALHQELKDCLSGQDNCLWPQKVYQRRRECEDWNDLLMLYDNPNCLPPDVNYPGIAPYE